MFCLCCTASVLCCTESSCVVLHCFFVVLYWDVMCCVVCTETSWSTINGGHANTDEPEMARTC